MKPLLFVVGDSISMHYGPYLERFVAPRFRYERKTGIEGDLDKPGLEVANGGDSSMVLNYLHYLKDREFYADVFLINCGLHDIKSTEGANQIPLEQYEANLRTLIPLWSSMAGKQVWVRTTMVDDEQHNTRSTFERFDADVERYNAVADRVMGEAGIAIIDLNGFSRTLENPWADHVHYREEVRPQQAAFLAGAVWDMAGSAS